MLVSLKCHHSGSTVLLNKQEKPCILIMLIASGMVIRIKTKMASVIAVLV
jgi:hypothetical protein